MAIFRDRSESSDFAPRGFAVVKLANHKAQMGVDLGIFSVDYKKHPRGYQEKLFVNMTNYDMSRKTPSTYLRHAIDGPMFRMIAHSVLAQRFKLDIEAQAFGPEPNSIISDHPQNPSAHYYQWREFKGGPAKDGQEVVSRVLSLVYTDMPSHKYPWTVVLTEGPGRTSKTGAVMPAGAPAHKVQMQLSEVQVRQ